MNYLFRDAMVDYFAKGSIDEATLDHRLQRMLMKYPEGVDQCMYNLIGSHDTPRFLTECGGDKEALRLAQAFQLLFPGAPGLYYGDELGMEGVNDPGCRGGMAWEGGDGGLREWVRGLIALRKAHPALRQGSYRTVLADSARRMFAFERAFEGERALVVFHRGDRPQTVDFADLGGTVDIPPMSVKIVIS
jgi:glycosidase